MLAPSWFIEVHLGSALFVFVARHSVATIKRAMEKILDTVAFMNIYVEDNIVFMFGGLHIELASLRSIGLYYRIVAGPAQFVTQLWRHLVLLNLSWLPEVSHQQGKHTRSQHAVYTIWWRRRARTTTQTNQEAHHWALKTGVFNEDGRVRSSSSGIWCYICCWPYILWSVLSEKENLNCTAMHSMRWSHISSQITM